MKLPRESFHVTFSEILSEKVIYGLEKVCAKHPTNIMLEVRPVVDGGMQFKCDAVQRDTDSLLPA